MSDGRRERIAATIGPDSVRAGDDGTLRATPPTTDAMAGLLGLAYDEGWCVAIAGNSSWQSDVPKADVLVVTRALDDVGQITFGGGQVTIPAGVPWDTARHVVGDHGAWLALDPPGRPTRTVGSVLATGTVGPLRAGYGPMRDQVSGLTVVTADGRVLRPTTETASDAPVGRHIGGFGGFGVITEATLALQAIPPAETTWITIGARDQLSAVAREFTTLGVTPAAAELISPALATEPQWLLAVRFVGTVEHLADQADRLHQLHSLHWQELAPDRRSVIWDGSARAHATLPVTLRLGVLAEGIDEAMDLIVDELGEGMLSAGAVSGMIRWSGHAAVGSLRELRAQFAARESPLTVERAPWTLLRTIGHSGSYRERIDGPIEQLRAEHDPRGNLVTAITGGESG